MQPKIIAQLKQANLTGRGGAGFPTWQKWEMVFNQPEKEKYVVCNLSEGEPGVFKDEHIIKHHLDEMIYGINLAIRTMKAKKAYIYINPEYYKKYKNKITKAIGNKKIVLFNKGRGAGYIGGEESSALNNIEDKRVEPRLRPPFPVQAGLFGKPTLINNCETFYHVALISKGKYQNRRFFSLSGDVAQDGVFELDESLTIEQILKTTRNYPEHEFFVQIGGGLCGQVLNQRQLTALMCGAGTIVVYNKKKTDGLKLIKSWADRYAKESCGKCVPCREGTYRLHEALNKTEPDFDLVVELCEAMENSAFCALGMSVATPILTYLKNIGKPI